jgi:hypothetical protein
MMAFSSHKDGLGSLGKKASYPHARVAHQIRKMAALEKAASSMEQMASLVGFAQVECCGYPIGMRSAWENWVNWGRCKKASSPQCYHNHAVSKMAPLRNEVFHLRRTESLADWGIEVGILCDVMISNPCYFHAVGQPMPQSAHDRSRQRNYLAGSALKRNPKILEKVPHVR